MRQTSQTLNDCARSGLVTSKERVHYYLEMIMAHAAKHPWMNWIMVRIRSDMTEHVHKHSYFSRSSCSGSRINYHNRRYAVQFSPLHLHLYLAGETTEMHSSDILRLLQQHIRLQWIRR